MAAEGPKQHHSRRLLSLTALQRTALKPVISIIGSLITLLLLVEATRRGQFPDIAGYSAGASIGALIAALTGSGTTLAYVTGDEVTQFSVRKVRHLVVAPAMVVSVIGAGLLYFFKTELALVPILLGGLAVVFSNLTELESGSLERRLRTPEILVATVASRSSGLLFLHLGLSFSGAMFVLSFVNYVTLRVLGRQNQRQIPKRLRLSESLKHAYAPSLMSLSVVGIVVNRAVLLVAPFLMSAELSGALSALVSAQQSITAVLIAGLYTMMAARAESGAAMVWMGRFASGTLILSALTAIISSFAAPIVVTLLNVRAFPESDLWWVLLSAAILPYVYNRRVQYVLLGEGVRGRALLLLGSIAGCTLLSIGCSVALRHSALLVASSLISEGIVGCVLVGGWVVRRLTAVPPAGELLTGEENQVT